MPEIREKTAEASSVIPSSRVNLLNNSESKKNKNKKYVEQIANNTKENKSKRFKFSLNL
jgi:hypothetical protein